MDDSNLENNTDDTTMEEPSVADPVGDSILLSIKKVLNLGTDNTDFDPDLLIHINSVFSSLQQLGVGPEAGFFIEDATANWTDYLVSDSYHLNMVKSYMAAKVRILFDPPVSSAVMDSLNRICSEFEWRSNVAAENKEHEEVSDHESSTDDP
jgi:hypothetical protein